MGICIEFYCSFGQGLTWLLLSLVLFPPPCFLCMPQGYGLGSEFRPADDQIAIVKLIKCLDHKKAKEIKSKSLGRKLKSFLSSHTHTHTRAQLAHTHNRTHRHADMHSLGTRNETEVESFIDELFDQLTAGHCPAEDTACFHLRVWSLVLVFYCLIDSIFTLRAHFHLVIPWHFPVRSIRLMVSASATAF